MQDDARIQQLEAELHDKDLTLQEKTLELTRVLEVFESREARIAQREKRVQSWHNSLIQAEARAKALGVENQKLSQRISRQRLANRNQHRALKELREAHSFAWETIGNLRRELQSALNRSAHRP